MLSLSHVQRIFLARAPADMRKQAPGLAALVSEGLGENPLSGDAFVFLNRHRTLVKVLVWDCSGFWVAAKRLERGRYGGKQWLAGREASGAVGLSIAQLLTLLEGVDVQQAAYNQHYALTPERLQPVADCASE